MWQHWVPRSYLDRFSKRGVLRRIVRATGEVTGGSSAVACALDDFYRVDIEGLDPNHFENAFNREFERFAKGAFDAITTADTFAPSDDVRTIVTRFLAIQSTRGPDARAMFNTVTTAVARRAFDPAGVPRDSSVRREFLPFGPDGETLTQSALVNLAFDVAPFKPVLAMRFALVRFANPSLVTSDRPLVAWGKPYGKPHFRVGIEVPHAVSLHLDPRHALLGVAAHVHRGKWTERVVAGTEEIARRLNERLARESWEIVLHHPDHAPLDGYVFPPIVTHEEHMERAERAERAPSHGSGGGDRDAKTRARKEERKARKRQRRK